MRKMRDTYKRSLELSAKVIVKNLKLEEIYLELGSIGGIGNLLEKVKKVRKISVAPPFSKHNDLFFGLSKTKRK